MPSTTKRPELRAELIVGGALALAVAITVALSTGNRVDETAAAESPPPPPPPPPPPAPAESPSPPPPAPPSAAGLRLYGLLGGGAVIAPADGRQRYYAVGREVSPGLYIARIEPQAVILASAGGEVRLGFDGAGTASPAGFSAPTTAAGSEEERLRDETLSYRIGLAARRAGSRTAGYVVRPGVSMPALERAGLRPGDVILSVNGSRFDEERMLELAWEIANAERTEFEIERGGRRMRVTLQSRP